ncbi:MAG: hypothetical protein QM739_18615 [Propionivibrio sp.]
MQALEDGQHLLEFGRVDRIGVTVAVDLEEQIRSADVGEDAVEHHLFLPGLAAERQRHQAGGFQLVERGEEVVDRFRFAGYAGLGEGRFGIPEPRRVVDVHRHRVVMAVDLDRVDDGLRQHRVPVLLAGDGVEIVEHAFVDQIAELLAGVELRGGRRVVADHAVDRRRARLFAAGDRRVDPLAASRRISLREFLDRRRFAAGSPPVDHFRARSRRLRRHRCTPREKRDYQFPGTEHV